MEGGSREAKNEGLRYKEAMAREGGRWERLCVGKDWDEDVGTLGTCGDWGKDRGDMRGHWGHIGDTWGTED